MCEQKTKCCAQCPFARTTTKEYLDTRGDNGEKFIGQAHGPFLLPCHMTAEFEDWRENEKVPLCAGAAKYRANVSVADNLPEALGRLPEDHEKVFSTPAELLAHHRGISIGEACVLMHIIPPLLLTRKELMDQRAKIALRPKTGANPA